MVDHEKPGFSGNAASVLRCQSAIPNLRWAERGETGEVASCGSCAHRRDNRDGADCDLWTVRVNEGRQDAGREWAYTHVALVCDEFEKAD
jgi:hypothetical protein